MRLKIFCLFVQNGGRTLTSVFRALGHLKALIVISNTQKIISFFSNKTKSCRLSAHFLTHSISLSIRHPYLANCSTCIYERNLKRKTWKISKDLFLYLSRSDFDVEVASLVRYFEDLGPGESVDTQPVSIDQQATGTHPQHDVNAFRVL